MKSYHFMSWSTHKGEKNPNMDANLVKTQLYNFLALTSVKLQFSGELR